ncbi:MAG: class I tRNA ligase family protein, partial [Pseudomonadota bacterium]|nr:class I tRNA ligase family protein [Pseudomonadota bacterium]
GAKMSKSKGNVIDPLAVIDDYGADALRFTLAAMAAQGRDIKLSAGRLEGSRNFATKLWNAARFAEMNACVTVPGFDPKSAKEILNRWIAHETAKAAHEVTQAIEDYKFNDAAGALYRFVWNIYCDWYLELAKPLLTGPDGAAKNETRAMVAWGRDEIVKLLHPFMPFITEELWAVTAAAVIPDAAQRRSGIQTQGPDSSLDSGSGAARRPGMTGRDTLLALTPWPAHKGLDDDKAEAEIGWLIDLVTAIRSVRTEINIPTDKFPIFIQASSDETFERVKRWRESLLRLARLGDISAVHAESRNLWKNVLRFFYYSWWRPNDFWRWRTVKIPTLRGAVQIVVRGETVFLPLAGVIDLAAERARLQKEMAKADADIARVDAKLGNADFLARAPEDVVDGEREKRDEADARREKILQALERLKGAA